MKCNAVGIRPDQKLTDSCGFVHGHAGPCNWVMTHASDDELRAECERRFGPDYVNGLPRVREANLVDERDEWKRRAEAAEAKMGDYYGEMTKVRNVVRESGPGIATAKPDNSVAWLDEDLLCEDAP